MMRSVLYKRCLRCTTAIVWPCESMVSVSPTSSTASVNCVSRSEKCWKGIECSESGKDSKRGASVWSQCRRLYSSGLLGAVTPAPSKLDAIIRLEEWKALDTSQVVHLWHSYYDARPSEAPASLTPHQWNRMQERMKQCPFSLIPLHKEHPPGTSSESESFMMMLAQAQLPQHILFTPLQEYQMRQADAVPHMVCTFYTELVASKDVCLARCDVLNPTHLNKDESVRLLTDAVLCYTTAELYEHIMAVNHGSDKFDLQKFLNCLKHHR